MEQETNKILKIDEFLQDRVLVDKVDKNISKNEKKFIISVLEEITFFKATLNKAEILDTLKLIDSNLEYDSYYFKNSGRDFVLKLTEDDEDYILKKEFDNLSLIQQLNISAKPLHFETLDFDRKIDVLIVTFEHALCFKDLPKSDLNFNIKTIANTLSFIHENTVTEELAETKSFKEEFFALTDYKNNLPEDRYKGLMNSEDFMNHLPVLETLKNAVNEELTALPKTQTCLNHTNLHKSRIMYRDKFVKFLNFQYAKKIDCLWDVSLCIFYLGISNYPKIEKDFVTQYLKSHDKLNISEPEFLEKLKTYKNTAYKLILIKLLCNYFYEAIIFGTDRSSKFVDTITIYEGIRDDLALDKNLEIKNGSVLRKVDKIFNVYFK
jgi:hypothetical protein